MSIFDDFFSDGKGAAADAKRKGYEDANRYLDPYYQGGVEDYNKYRGDIDQFGNTLSQYGNPADWMWKQINQDPQDFYDSLMSGYEESPMAKYEQDQAMRAATNGASASGMLGSGSYFDTLQQNAADIAARDRDRYYNNVRGAMGDQYNFLNNFQGQQRDYRNARSGLAGMGYNTARDMGQNAIGAGQANADRELADAQGWNNIIGRTAGIAAGWW